MSKSRRPTDSQARLLATIAKRGSGWTMMYARTVTREACVKHGWIDTEENGSKICNMRLTTAGQRALERELNIRPDWWRKAYS